MTKQVTSVPSDELFAWETQFDLTRTIPQAVLKSLIHGAQEWYDHVYENARWADGGLSGWYEDDKALIREFHAVTTALKYMLKDESTRTFPDP